jgi:hypothetical protein
LPIAFPYPAGCGRDHPKPMICAGMAADTFTAGHGLRPSFDPESMPFFYEAAVDGRLVTRLYGIDTDGEAVRIAAEIYPVHAPETNDPQWRFYDFPTRKHARHFAEETLLALEYLGCNITESEPLVADSRSRATGASDRFAA